MFYEKKHQKKQKSVKPSNLGKLTPVLAPKIIISDVRRYELVKNILTNLNISAVRHEQAVTPLLDEVASNCQLLPSNQHLFYTQAGGLIDYALYRAQSAMALFRQVALPPNTRELSDVQARWAYVMFSASLLKGMGCVCTDYVIDVHDGEGHLLGQWHALWERLVDRADFYYSQPDPKTDDSLRAHLTPLIARTWMPQSGLAWIAEDPEALLTWLQLLQEEHEGFNILEAILERAESMAWQELAKLSLAGLPAVFLGPDARLPSFNDASTHDQQLQSIGLQFILWIRENLARGQMLLNESPLIALHNGLLISPDAFKWFLQHHPQFRNWRLIQQGLMSLGLHDKQFQNDNATAQGLLINKAGLLLPMEVICKQANNNHHFKTQALLISSKHQWKEFAQGKSLELAFLNKHLHANGQWLDIDPNASLSPGMQNG